ncbi:MAG: TIGR03435 family protein [Ignavibacteriota bacterium]
MMAPGNRARIMGTQATVADLALRLSELLSRPVTDATGLNAKFDIQLTFSTEGLNIAMGGPGGPGMPGGGPGGPEGVQPQGDPPPDLFSAIQSQLGLRLAPKKGAIDVLIVDSVDKVPVEN